MQPPKVKPPLVALFIIILTLFLHYNLPIIKIIPRPYNLFGILLAIIGIYLGYKAKITFDKHKTSFKFKKPTRLLTTGPYKYTRNPMYLSLTVFLLGFSVLLGSLISFIAPVLFFLVTNIFYIPFEEKWLEELFGNTYLEYKRKVRRWI